MEPKLALARLQETAVAYLTSTSASTFRGVMQAIITANDSGATHEQIRHALVSADAETAGRQSAEAAARLSELLSGY